MLARERRHCFRSQPRVLQIAAAGRLDDEIDLAAIAHRYEPRTAYRQLQPDREHECSAREQRYRETMIERPRDYELVVVGLAVKPAIEACQSTRNRPAARLLV